MIRVILVGANPVVAPMQAGVGTLSTTPTYFYK